MFGYTFGTVRIDTWGVNLILTCLVAFQVELILSPELILTLIKDL
jgi:hypothetical protein